MEVDGRLEILEVPESAGQALDPLHLAVEPLAHRVGHRMVDVGQDVVDVSATVSTAVRIGPSRLCVAQQYQRFQPEAGET